MNNNVGVMYEGVGTLYSMSPQVLQGIYTSQADLWSCGVIAYMLLSSHRPFYHKRRAVMIDRIMRVDYSFEKEYWDAISDEAKNFIDQLLVLDPKKRMDAGEALKHTWLSKEFSLSDRVPDQSTAYAVQGNLVQYKEASQLKKIALNVRDSTPDWEGEIHSSHSFCFSFRSSRIDLRRTKLYSFEKFLINSIQEMTVSFPLTSSQQQ